MPVLIGWAAVTGSLGWPPVVLFGVVFFWTPPHFWRWRSSSRTTTPAPACRCCPSWPLRASRADRHLLLGDGGRLAGAVPVRHDGSSTPPPRSSRAAASLEAHGLDAPGPPAAMRRSSRCGCSTGRSPTALLFLAVAVDALLLHLPADGRDPLRRAATGRRATGSATVAGSARREPARNTARASASHRAASMHAARRRHSYRRPAWTGSCCRPGCRPGDLGARTLGLSDELSVPGAPPRRPGSIESGSSRGVDRSAPRCSARVAGDLRRRHRRSVRTGTAGRRARDAWPGRSAGHGIQVAGAALARPGRGRLRPGGPGGQGDLPGEQGPPRRHLAGRRAVLTGTRRVSRGGVPGRAPGDAARSAGVAG